MIVLKKTTFACSEGRLAPALSAGEDVKSRNRRAWAAALPNLRMLPQASQKTHRLAELLSLAERVAAHFMIRIIAAMLTFSLPIAASLERGKTDRITAISEIHFIDDLA